MSQPKPRIKVLPLESWMEWDSVEDCLSLYPTTAPTFHRPGIYRTPTQCWFELVDGRAFEYPTADFDFALRLLEAERLTARQAAALQAVVAQRLATKAQRQLLRDYEDHRQCRAVYRNSRKTAMRILRDVQLSAGTTA